MDMIYLKSPSEIATMKKNGAILRDCLEKAGDMVKPGVKKKDIDTAVEAMIVKAGAKPGFKGFQGYPASTCISVNEEVVHAMPNGAVLEEGDICSIDIGVLKDGYYVDAARTFAVGKVQKEAQALVDATREALEKGIAQARPGNRLSDISHAVESYTMPKGFSVVKTLVGHGIGAVSMPVRVNVGCRRPRYITPPPIPQPISMKELVFSSIKASSAAQVCVLVKYKGTRSPAAFQKTINKTTKQTRYIHDGMAKYSDAPSADGNRSRIGIHHLANFR